jgi:hypothetical protein
VAARERLDLLRAQDGGRQVAVRVPLAKLPAILQLPARCCQKQISRLPGHHLYVDETGNETRGRLFVVAVVCCRDRPDLLTTECENWEEKAQKHSKWTKTHQSRRMIYMRAALRYTPLHGNLFYFESRNSINYDQETVHTIARVLQSGPASDHAKIYVDALSKTHKNAYGAQLRRVGIHGHKVQGVARDENSALIRLADALAGFVRDALENKYPETTELFRAAVEKGVIREV